MISMRGINKHMWTTACKTKISVKGEYSSTVRALNLSLERWQNEFNATVVTFSATNLKVVPTCFLTICSCFSWRTDTKVCGSKLTTQFSSSTWFLTKTTCKEWELKITENWYFHVFNMLELFRDSKNHRGGTDAKFFQFKKQFVAVIWF